jgi:hypothetical protein
VAGEGRGGPDGIRWVGWIVFLITTGWFVHFAALVDDGEPPQRVAALPNGGARAVTANS